MEDKRKKDRKRSRSGDPQPGSSVESSEERAVPGTSSQVSKLNYFLFNFLFLNPFCWD